MTIRPSADRYAQPSRAEARLAGACYLFVIGAGIFAAVAVRESLFVAGDAAATVQAIAARSALWRAGIAVHLTYLLAGAAVGVILYRIFRDAQPTLALLALVLTISDVALEALLMTALYVPLILMDEPTVFQVFNGEQRAALSYLALRGFFSGWSFALFLFGGFCIAIGMLILRSRLVPRLIGVLMIAAGASYIILTLSQVLAPVATKSFAAWLLIPPFIGELSLAVWLTVKGVAASGSHAPSSSIARSGQFSDA